MSKGTSWIDLRLVRQMLTNSSLHVGELKWSCSETDINGWKVCDGRELSITDYKELYAVIGDRFGGGEGTFNIPDCRSRVMAACGEDRTMGTTAGEETHTLTSTELPGHTHSGTTASSGDHTHTTSTSGAHTHTTNATGGSIGLAVMDGTNTLTTLDSSSGELNNTTTRALAIDSAGAHAHDVSSSGVHTHTFTTASTGDGESFNIMQPTLFGGNVLIFAGYVKSARFFL